MCRLECGNTLGCGNETHETDVGDAALLEHIDRVDRAAAGCQHGVNQDDNAVLNILGQLAVVFDRGVRLGVAVQTDVTDLGNGHEGEQTVHHAEACTQDRHDRQLLAGDALARHLLEGGLDLVVLNRQVARDLVAHQHRDLVEQFAEVLGTGLGLAHNRQLMRDQGMIEYM